MKRILTIAGLMTMALAAAAANAQAATIKFFYATEILQPNVNQDNPVTGSTLPLGSLTFTDVSAGVVSMTLQSSLSVATEFFTSIGFNGSFLNNAHLGFTFASSTGTFNVGGAAIGTSNDALSVFPPDRMDYRIVFNSPGTSAATWFGENDSITYTITCLAANLATCGAAGANPLDATDFNSVNSGNPNPLHNGWYTVGSFGYGTDSDGRNYGDNNGADNAVTAGTFGATAVPEPGSLVLLGTGLLVLARRYTRRK